jgi:AP-2 complex subunit sigma-1
VSSSRGVSKLRSHRWPLRHPQSRPQLTPQVRLRGEVHRLIAPRDQKYQSNFVEVSAVCSAQRSLTLQFRNDKIVYRRYAGLFFCVCVDSNDNELAYLEAIHLFVEVLGELRE